MGGGDSTLLLGSDQHSMLPETQENYKHMKTLIEERAASQQSQNEIIRLKTEIEILNITVRHLQEDLKGKSDTIKSQQKEIGELQQKLRESNTKLTLQKADAERDRSRIAVPTNNTIIGKSTELSRPVDLD